MLRDAQEREAESLAPKRDDLEHIEAMLGDCDMEATECAVAMRIAKGRVKEKLERQQDEINARYEALSTRREKLHADLGARQLTDDRVSNALQFREDFELGMKNPTFDDKRQMLETLKVEVTVQGGKASVKCVIPMPSGEFALNTCRGGRREWEA